MSYTVLARRYRSQTFDDVVGQDAISQTLKNAISAGRVAHGYLFCGTRGVGKTTVARILAKALNCQSYDSPTTTPCCKCPSCVAINTGDDIDVLEIDGASNNGVDDVRQLREKAIYKPARSRYKIYIIDEVHMLSASAFNALLKILEEPPAHLKFIFATTEPHKVLATIQSRCQRFDFVNINPSDIAKQLKFILNKEKFDCQPDVITVLSRLANGSMRDSLSLLDQLISTGQPLTVKLLEEVLGQPPRQKVAELVDFMAEKDAANVLDNLDILLAKGISASAIVDSLEDVFRDLLIIKAAGKQSKLAILTETEREQFISLADKFDIPSIIYGISAAEKLRYTVKNSDNPRAILEAVAIRLTLSEHFIGTKQLLESLEGKSFAVKNTAQAESPKKKIVAQADNNNVSNSDETEQQCSSDTIERIVINPLNTQNIQSNWSVIVNAVSPVVKGTNYLLNGRILSFDNSRLVVEMPENLKFAVELMEKPYKISAINSALSQALGSEIKVAFKISENSPTIFENEPVKPKGAKLSQNQRDDILKYPPIKMVLDGLNANVVSIEKY